MLMRTNLVDLLSGTHEQANRLRELVVGQEAPRFARGFVPGTPRAQQVRGPCAWWAGG